MKPELQLWLTKLEDDDLTPQEVEELARLLKTDPAARRELVGHGVLTGGIRRYFLKAAGAELVAEKSEDILQIQMPPGSQPPVMRRMNGRMVALAAAASFAVVAGVWWFAQARQPAGLGLRVAEIQESGGRGQASGVPVLIWGASKGVPLVVGMELRQGDRVVVHADGQVRLKYDAEKTWIGLKGAAATFQTKDGGKYVKLGRGRLTCSAAPQHRPFRIETRHGFASVIGTRFSINVSDQKTDLSVTEGKVQCEQAGKTLTVGPGQTAEVSAQGMKVSLPAEPRPGLAYEFFGRPSLENQRGEGTTPDIGPEVGGTHKESDWGFRFTGLLTAPADGDYLLRAEANTGVRVVIDEQRIIDGWAQIGARTGHATLTKAMPATIVVEYFFVPAWGRKPPTLRLFWTPPGGQEEPVPAAAYLHSPGVHAASAQGKGLGVRD